MMRRLAQVLLIAASPIAFAPTAWAHDHWISHGGYRGPVNNEWCCGAEDCVIIPEAQVKPNGLGYLLTGNKETVPYSEALPSEDGKYWRCQRPNGTRRCFFAPLQGF